MRLGPFFVALCIVVIAASAGAVVYFGFGFAAADAIIVAVAVLTALALYNTVSSRLNVRAVVGSQLTDLARGIADLARQVAEMGRRLAVVEARMEKQPLTRGDDTGEPLAGEISELGTLVNQLAETVALHEALLNELERMQRTRIEPPAPPPMPMRIAAPASPPPPAPAPAEPVALAPPPPPPEPVVAMAAPIPPPAPEPARVDPAEDAAQAQAAEMLAAIRAAIDSNRIDLHLQPIVTLPQRKVRYYEAMSRLRTEAGSLTPAGQFVPQAEAAGLMPRIDNLVVFRCVQVLRRLLLKNREVGVFCNLSASTLTDSATFPQLLEFLDANRAIAASLVLEFTQAGLRGIGPIESESLAALNERGFRFSLDNVTDLRLEPRELASRGFRFVKLPANLLLNRIGAAADIHPADFPNLFARFGIDLVAERIESEGMVVDLLDFDVKFGQGFLFSPPRPVRAEALQGIPDRGDATGREAAAESETRTPSAEASKSPRPGAIAQLARRV